MSNPDVAALICDALKIIDDFFLTLCFCRLLVGAPYEMNGAYQTGDVYKCSLTKRTNGNGCTKLNLGKVTHDQ